MGHYGHYLGFVPAAPQPASFLYVEELNMDDAAVDKDASYNGAQIASAVEVLVNASILRTRPKCAWFKCQLSPHVDALFVEGISAIGIEEEEAVEETQDQVAEVH